MKNLSFGAEIFVRMNAYKISDSKLSELRKKYGACLSFKQLSEIKDQNEDEDGLIIGIEDLVIHYTKCNPCVIISKDTTFKTYGVYCHGSWNLSNQSVYITDVFSKYGKLEVGDIGRDFEDYIVCGNYFIDSINFDTKYENGFYKKLTN